MSTITRPGGRTARVGQAVMESTLDELADAGYADFSVERVADRAGVNKTTLYRRWGGRDELVAAAIHSAPPDNDPLPDAGSLRGDLFAYAHEHMAYFGDERSAAITRVMNSTTSPALLAARRALFEHREARLRSLFARARRRGELTSMQGVDTAISLLFGSAHHHAFVMGRPVTTRWLERTADLVLAGLRVAQNPTSG